MKKLLITNLVYGDVYAKIFLNFHLKAFLDESNIPAVANRVEYLIFSDADTIPHILAHENYHRLKRLIPADVQDFGVWPANMDRFNERYSMLVRTFKHGVTVAMNRGMNLSALVADLVPAKDYLPKVIAKLDEGHDAVFMHPFRSAMEPMSFELDKQKGAMSALEFFELGYKNMHPLFVACHWNTTQFTKMPFTLLWGSRFGILARSFSITPIAFTPFERMKSVTGVIDVDVPSFFKNPYWCRGWTEAPIMGVEPLQCYYPPFANHKATSAWVKEWALKSLRQHQFEYLKTPLYYPNEGMAEISDDMKKESDRVVKEIAGG